MLGLKKLGALLSDAMTPSYRMPPNAVMGPGSPTWQAEQDPRDANWTPEEGDWIETTLFNKFYFVNPDPLVIDLYDIAQALGHLARFNGHYKPEIAFYSVAEHCYLLAEYANLKWGPAAGLEALLHDAAEAYVGDLTRPFKNTVPAVKVIEDNVEKAVRKRFELAEVKPDWMRKLDHQMLATERLHVKGKSTLPWAGEDVDTLPMSFRFFTPNRARDCFLDLYFQLNHDLKETSR